MNLQSISESLNDGDGLTEGDRQTRRLPVVLVDHRVDSISFLYVHLYPTIHPVLVGRGSIDELALEL